MSVHHAYTAALWAYAVCTSGLEFFSTCDSGGRAGACCGEGSDEETTTNHMFYSHSPTLRKGRCRVFSAPPAMMTLSRVEFGVSIALVDCLMIADCSESVL